MNKTMAGIDDIKSRAAQIKNATEVGENTAPRVGGVIEDLANLFPIMSGSIADKNVIASKLGDGAVTTAKIADGNVTKSKLSIKSVSFEKLDSDVIKYIDDAAQDVKDDMPVGLTGVDVHVGNVDVDRGADSVSLHINTIETVGGDADATDATIPAATQEKAGVMTAEDKRLLDSMPTEIERLQGGDKYLKGLIDGLLIGTVPRITEGDIDNVTGNY